MKSTSQHLLAWLVASGWVYFTGLFGWLGLYLLTGDHWEGLSLFTSVVHLAFWPVPGFLGLAALTRRRSLWVGSSAAVVVWLALFGGLFNFPMPPARAATPTIRAMTYNVEFQNTDVEAVTTTIRAADADVVGLQELNPALAENLSLALAEEYPYQLFSPRVGVAGMGLLSRYPIKAVATQDYLYGFWIGDPQVVVVELPSGPIVLMNTHFAHSNRDENAAQVARWAAAQAKPVVVVGDMNATDLSDAHRLLKDSGLHDAWREVGWGYGSTFLASSRVALVGGVPVYVPGRLVRIDYVFHTSDLTPCSVERLPWDGESDHLAVVAELSRAAE